ncbi:nucleoside 2-deoxyribosyltransferase [Methanoregula sp. UBA64]|jgi:nucleoside 2-deoxyribosyltransferase/predicted secreted protein|uniref:nucleoside 2-deoxyribosyltransferase n=1 Tax=Methanoregula sp. UBA64 TaxID=1915554 RepID=UPI0025D1E9C3|nr:nucleoside 2-deoxyribosyltransferase [Methanoregula sp. UBA64]
MYVLCAPCILSPALRAKGITHPSDIALFAKSIGRCKKFGIEVVPLPCPETRYLGADREPGTFLERLNTPEFATLLDELVGKVNDIVKERGPPLCILGVNSSPTCGVTSTYYGTENGRPPKREGRGVFYAKFPEIPALDVTEFSQYRVYLAAPLFSEAERSYNARVAAVLKEHCFEVFLPQESGDNHAIRGRDEHRRIFAKNKRAIHDADIVIAIIDGADADSGTAWEMGYAAALKKNVIALRTDFRMAGSHERVNLMLEEGATVVSDTGGMLAALGMPVVSRPEKEPAVE